MQVQACSHAGIDHLGGCSLDLNCCPKQKQKQKQKMCSGRHIAAREACVSLMASATVTGAMQMRGSAEIKGEGFGAEGSHADAQHGS